MHRHQPGGQVPVPGHGEGDPSKPQEGGEQDAQCRGQGGDRHQPPHELPLHQCRLRQWRVGGAQGIGADQTDGGGRHQEIDGRGGDQREDYGLGDGALRVLDLLAQHGHPAEPGEGEEYQGGPFHHPQGAIGRERGEIAHIDQEQSARTKSTRTPTLNNTKHIIEPGRSLQIPKG